MLGPPLRSPVCIFRASKPVHQSMADEVEFISPHREGFHRNCRPALAASGLPCAVYLPFLLFRHPAMGKCPAPVPGPSQSEALRACGKQAGLRGRRLQMTLTSSSAKIPITWASRFSFVRASVWVLFGRERRTLAHHHGAFLMHSKARCYDSTCSCAPKGKSSDFLNTP